MACSRCCTFSHVSSLILDIGTKTLQIKLREELIKIKLSLVEFISEHNHKLFHLYKRTTCCRCDDVTVRKKAILTAEQWHSMFMISNKKCINSVDRDVSTHICMCQFETKKHLDISKFDITLISCLLLNLFNLPPAEKQDLKNLRQKRNQLIAHCSNTKAGNFENDFEFIAGTIEAIAFSCGQYSSIKKEIEMLRVDWSCDHKVHPEFDLKNKIGEGQNEKKPNIMDSNSSTVKTKGEYWCSVAYYEFKCRIGDNYYVTTDTFTVDGFYAKHPARLGLGGLVNVSRTQRVELIRQQIGKGIKFSFVDGDVYVHSLGEYSVFVQSQILNLHNCWSDTTVHKISSGSRSIVFVEKEFQKQLKISMSKGLESVHQLAHKCTIRLSFVKGFGPSYRRAFITSTECWIEVHLNKPLQCLDEVLLKMGSPIRKCTSRS